MKRLSLDIIECNRFPVQDASISGGFHNAGFSGTCLHCLTKWLYALLPSWCRSHDQIWWCIHTVALTNLLTKLARTAQVSCACRSRLCPRKALVRPQTDQVRAPFPARPRTINWVPAGWTRQRNEHMQLCNETKLGCNAYILYMHIS